jgi:tRNA(Ile)-lysidine synthase
MQPRGARGLIRPLLPFSRAELSEHIEASGLAVFHDPANADLRHTRSWLRHIVIPTLEQRLGDEAVRSLLSVAQHAGADLAAWDAVLEAVAGLEIHTGEGRFDVARAGLTGYDSVLAARLVRAAARRAGLMIGPAQAERIVRFAKDTVSGRTLELGDGLTAQAAFDRLVVQGATMDPQPASITSDAGETRFGEFQLRWQGEVAPAALHREGWTTWLRPGPVEVRTPQPGERMVPLGGIGHRSVSRLLMEGRIPRGERSHWPLVVRAGEPLWIPGVCRGQGAVPEPGTLAVRMDIAAAR